MPESSASAPIQNFAQFEAAGGKIAEPTEAAEPEEAEETPSEAADSSETAVEPEAADDQSEQDTEPPKPQPPKHKKLSLAEEKQKLLKEVTALRRERRELQHPPSPPAPQADAVQPEEEAPPVRPKLSTFKGTLEEFEQATDEYDKNNAGYLQRQWERREQAQARQSAQERTRRIYGEQVLEHVKAHPEYDAEIEATPMSPVMVEVVFHKGPALGQLLIGDKEEAARIKRLSPSEQIFEMGKLWGRLQNGDAEPNPDSDDTTPRPAKVPAKLGGGSHSANAAVNQPGHGAKNFAQFEAIKKRLAEQRLQQRRSR